MRTHITEADYKRLMDLQNDIKGHSSNSRIGYSGEPIAPPKILYARMQPAGYSETHKKDIDNTKVQNEGKRKLIGGFLVLFLIILLSATIFS